MSCNRTWTTVRNRSTRTTDYSVIIYIFCLSISREYPLCLNQSQDLSCNCACCTFFFFYFATIHPQSNGLKLQDILILTVPLPIPPSVHLAYVSLQESEQIILDICLSTSTQTNLTKRVPVPNVSGTAFCLQIWENIKFSIPVSG